MFTTIIISFLALLSVIVITDNLFTIHKLKTALKVINEEKYELETQLRLLQLKYDRAENLRKVKSGEIKKCKNCEYSQVEVDFDNQYAGTTDCQGFYVDSHSTCDISGFKDKYADEFSTENEE